METIDQNTHLAEELAEIATQLQRSFLVELSTEVNRGNISIPQYTLLGFLNKTSGLNMSQLAELMRHTTPATTGTMAVVNPTSVSLTGLAYCRLARSTIAGASALLEASGEEPVELRRQVTSPGGTTQAALDVLMGQGGLGPLLQDAVAAAVLRSKELAG